MDYNTQREQMRLPEYGRTIQQMVDYCRTIEDEKERTKAAHTVIAIMGNMNPHLRDVADFKHKLWDHLAIMSDFKLNVEWPYPFPDIEVLNKKPEKLEYSDGEFKYKHYGKFVEEILNRINDYEDPERRESLIVIMANHMKRSYTLWKNEEIQDEIIFKELLILTKGEIEIPEGLELREFKDVLVKKHHNQSNKSNSNRKKTYHKRK